MFRQAMSVIDTLNTSQCSITVMELLKVTDWHTLFSSLVYYCVAGLFYAKYKDKLNSYRPFLFESGGEFNQVAMSLLKLSISRCSATRMD